MAFMVVTAVSGQGEALRELADCPSCLAWLMAGLGEAESVEEGVAFAASACESMCQNPSGNVAEGQACGKSAKSV